MDYKGLNFTICEVDDQGKIRASWKHNYHHIFDIIIFVIDSSDLNNIKESSEIVKQMLDKEVLKKFSFLIVANKQDLDVAFTENQIR